MDAVVVAKVRSLGNSYADGTPRLEINLPSDRARGLAFVRPEKTDVTLRIKGVDYTGSVLANKPDHDIVWFSPTLSGPSGERLRMGKILTDAGFQANDTVQLVVSGLRVEVVDANTVSPTAEHTTSQKMSSRVEVVDANTVSPGPNSMTGQPTATVREPRSTPTTRTRLLASSPRVEIVGMVTTQAGDPAGRMQRTKLILEIAAVTMTVISGVVALVLRLWWKGN